MRRLLMVFAIALAVQPARGDEAVLPTGTWVGFHDGQPLIWEILTENRLRMDGRPGDFEIRADSLIVRFDDPARADPDPGCREVAVYRFVASAAQNGTARLFVSGFDLGKQGALLMREPSEQANPGGSEDAAPALPPRETKQAQRTAATPGPGAHGHR